MSDSEDVQAVFALLGVPYGMSAEDTAVHLLLGERKNKDAPKDECGAVDPRNERKWCRRPKGHKDYMHNCYRLDEDWK